MQINEIEVSGASASFKAYKISRQHDDMSDTFQQLTKSLDEFDLESELPGLHDCECQNDIIRGYYSLVAPFEVEHLKDGVITKTLFKKIESCEFFITDSAFGDDNMFISGKSEPGKIFSGQLRGVFNICELSEFDFFDLSNIQNKMAKIKAVVVINPKEKEIRRARLAGHMEDYTEYNILDRRNHDLESVSGELNTPLGPMTVTVGRKGSIKLTVKRGMIITTDLLDWIVSNIKTGGE